MAADWKQMLGRAGLGEEFFKRGGTTFDSVEIWDDWQTPPAQRKKLDATIRRIIGPVKGKRVLDLQCGQGEATLTWARLGAVATGVDQSEERLALARAKARALRVPAVYVHANVLRLPFRKGSFDLAYTGGGTVVWLPDIRRWAREVSRVIRPGGRLVVFEYHPFLHCIDWTKGKATLKGDYFDQRPEKFADDSSYGPQVETRWRVMDYVNALAEAGMTLGRMEEFPILRRLSKETPRFPHRLLMIFRKL